KKRVGLDGKGENNFYVYIIIVGLGFIWSYNIFIFAPEVVLGADCSCDYNSGLANTASILFTYTNHLTQTI
ncbi:MAG: hypothetical protein ABIC82_05550, partial [bacterium]